MLVITAIIVIVAGLDRVVLIAITINIYVVVRVVIPVTDVNIGFGVAYVVVAMLAFTVYEVASRYCNYYVYCCFYCYDWRDCCV